MKQPDEGDTKYDWTIVKEYFPQPVSPTDRSEADRVRIGLKPSKTIEEVGKNEVILSNLTVIADQQTTKAYFENVYLTEGDKDKVVCTDTDKVTTKKIMVVSLPSKQDCLNFK